MVNIEDSQDFQQGYHNQSSFKHQPSGHSNKLLHLEDGDNQIVSQEVFSSNNKDDFLKKSIMHIARFSLFVPLLPFKMGKGRTKNSKNTSNVDSPTKEKRVVSQDTMTDLLPNVTPAQQGPPSFACQTTDNNMIGTKSNPDFHHFQQLNNSSSIIPSSPTSKKTPTQQTSATPSSSNNTSMNLSGLLLKNRWKIQGLLGSGSFGSIYCANDLVTTEEVAIKVEKTTPNQNTTNGQQPTPSSLKVEVCALRNLQDCRYVVTYIHSGRQYLNVPMNTATAVGASNNFESVTLNFLVMERLGESLAELRRRTQAGTFNMTTTLRCGVQMIDCLQEVHKKGYLHRDVKPANFVIGRSRNTRGRIFLIDFGLARAFKHEDGNLKPARSNVGFRGTPRYASLNAHLGIELGRRDDMWSIFFIMVEMATGNLPWRKLRDKAQIGKLKELHTLENSDELLRGLPPQFTAMLKYLKDLQFETEPDYEYLKTICKSYFAPHKEAIISSSYEECQFEWITRQNDERTLSSRDLSLYTTNPDRTDSRSRTTKLSTAVVFGSNTPRSSTQGFAGNDFSQSATSLPEWSFRKSKSSKKNQPSKSGGLDRTDRQVHCKCSIM